MQFLRLEDVIVKTTLPNTDMWEEIEKDNFPIPYKLKKFGRINVWDLYEVDLWIYFRKLDQNDMNFLEFLKMHPNPEEERFKEIMRIELEKDSKGRKNEKRK